jgi:Fe-S-cluster-containing dehydrogenase component
MDKCDYCLGNDVPLGEQPYCIKACRFDALHYGLISEFPSKVTGDLIRVEGSTGSSLYLSYE